MEFAAWLGEEARRKPNTLQIWGNATTMNLNTLILTNITNSPYFKGQLQELKTYHEVVDEIYYKVKHLEPWEKGSRRTAGQTGMCGGVRGVGAGGVISTAFCILYKLFTMRITRKQVVGLMNHTDSPYIRGLGFMYVRFTQPPADLWEWFESYIDDAEEVDVRAGGGQIITIGEMVRLFLTKLDWFSSLFPRIPVPIQIGIDQRLAELQHATSIDATPRKIDNRPSPPPQVQQPPVKLRNAESTAGSGSGGSGSRHRSRSRSPRERSSHHRRDRSRDRDRSDRRDKDKKDSSRKRSRSRDRDRERRRSRSRSPSSKHHRRHHKDKGRDKDRDRDRHRR